MSDFGDAIGTMAEGALLSSAIEGERGKPLDHGHFAEGACLNCGTELVGPHCHNCGQQAHLHRTLGAFLHDLLHGALHFEGRTWKTLPMLAFKPGQLTRRYIEGERARFVSPMALFLFSIFLMFAVFQLAGISTPTDVRTDAAGQIRVLAQQEIDQIRQDRAETAAELERADLSDEQRAKLEQRLRSLDDDLDGVRSAEENVPFLAGIVAPQVENTASATDADKAAETHDNDDNAIVTLEESDTVRAKAPDTTGVGWIDAALKKWRANPGLMLYKLQTNFYKFSWLLIPLSIPFVWVLFAWKRRFRAYDHAIFVTYSLSFMTLLILAITLLGLIGLPAGWLVFASLAIPPLHIYKQLRGAYGLSRGSALWRLAVLNVFIVIVLTLFLQLLLVIGAY